MLEIVTNAHEYAARWLGVGKVASYIPSLANVEPNQLAVAITDKEGITYSAGDDDNLFTMQSVAKVLLLATALREVGFETVFRHVGMESTGDPFNSIIRLETMEIHKPQNPMINAGAIAVTSCIRGKSAQKRFEFLLEYARELLGNPQLTLDEDTFISEMKSGDRNRALGYMLRSTGVICSNVEQDLEVYFKACSILANCKEISFLGAVLAYGGVSPRTGKQLIDPTHVKYICAIMSTCGLYDASGEFALRVGIPAKSGVGGGILGVVPGKMGIGVFSPALDVHGNSVCGINAMEYLSNKLSLSVFSSVN